MTHKPQTPFENFGSMGEAWRKDDDQHHQRKLCCVKRHKTRTAEVTICIISEVCPIALDSYRTPQSGNALPPSEAQSIVVKHRHPRMNVKAVSVTQWCFFAQQSTETPKLSRDIEDGLREGRWVAAQKRPQQHLAGETSLLGATPESNRGCPGPRDIKRDGHNRLETSVKPALSISSQAKVQSQQRSSPRWGNGRSRAQWETFKKWCGFGTSISKCTAGTVWRLS